jgi:hypothetical protein
MDAERIIAVAEAGFDRMEARLDEITARVNALVGRMIRLEDELRQMRAKLPPRIARRLLEPETVGFGEAD